MTASAIEFTVTDDVPCIPREAFLSRARGRRVRVITCAARDFEGPLFNATVYMAMATAFLILIVDWGWTMRFLIAVGFFLAVAAMCASDVFDANRVTFYRVETIDGGEQLAYATPLLEDAEAVAAGASPT